MPNSRVAFVTGGGRGIGAATARALVRAGIRVAIGDIDHAAAQKTAAALGTAAIALQLDVTDRPGFTAVLDQVERRLGPIDVLINNAGIMPLGMVEQETDESATRQIEINLHAVIHGTKEAVRRMRPRRHGHIINIASGAGVMGFAGGATYSATKFAVIGFSEAVRAELRGSGIEISVVIPAIVRTELAGGLKDSRWVKSIQPEDVAEAIVHTLGSPRFDVFVPRMLGLLFALLRSLPRGLRDAMTRATKSDRVLIDAAGSSERAVYETRAAAGAPLPLEPDNKPS